MTTKTENLHFYFARYCCWILNAECYICTCLSHCFACLRQLTFFVSRILHKILYLFGAFIRFHRFCSLILPPSLESKKTNRKFVICLFCFSHLYYDFCNVILNENIQTTIETVVRGIGIVGKIDFNHGISSTQTYGKNLLKMAHIISKEKELVW